MATGKQGRGIYGQGIIIYGSSSFTDLAASLKRGEDLGERKSGRDGRHGGGGFHKIW